MQLNTGHREKRGTFPKLHFRGLQLETPPPQGLSSNLNLQRHPTYVKSICDKHCVADFQINTNLMLVRVSQDLGIC